MGGCLGCTWGVESKPITQINTRRSCTDVPFLLLFTAFAVVMLVIFATYVDQGADPQKLVRGVDYLGNICDEDTSLAMWPDPKVYDFKICTSSCDETQTHPLMVDGGYESTEVLWYCVPTADSGESIKGLSAPTDVMSQYMGDLETSKWIVLSGIGMAVALSVIYSWLLKKMASVIVWFSILLILAGAICVAIALFYVYQNDETTAAEKQKLLGLGIGVCVFSFIFVCVVIFLRTRIAIATEVVAMSSHSLSDMHWLQVLPVFPLVILVAFFLYWIYEAVTLFSVSEEILQDIPESILNICQQQEGEEIGGTTGVCEDFGLVDTFVHLKFNRQIQDVFILHAVYLLWTMEFLFFITYNVIAGAVADWYFTPGDRRSLTRTSPVWRSTKRVFRYHLGTIAFGSLIISICQCIRSIFMALEGSIHSRANGIQRALGCICGCCLRFVDCCIGKVTRSAFVFSSIYGDAFCHAAWSSAALLMRNIARVAAIHMVGDYLVVLGKLLVAMASTGICGFILTRVEPYASKLSSPIFPLVIIFVLSYVICSIFMVIFETAMDTIFVCFLVDEECNKTSEGGMLASEELRNLVDKYEQVSIKRAQSYGRRSAFIELEEQPKGLLSRNAPRSDAPPSNVR